MSENIKCGVDGYQPVDDRQIMVFNKRISAPLLKGTLCLINRRLFQVFFEREPTKHGNTGDTWSGTREFQ
jgi:hypothetical protein